MPRRREVPKRTILPDPKFGDQTVAKFVNVIMLNGKKSIAEKILYGALDVIKEKGTGNVPLHLRNAPTELMKNLDYGKNYKYPHSYPDGFVKENYFPEELNENPKFYNPKELGREKFLKERLAYLKSIDN